MNRRQVLKLGLSATAVALAGCASSLEEKRLPPVQKKIWMETFVDDFAGQSGEPPDPTKWLVETGKGALVGGNGESEVYTDSPSNVSQDGKGNLAITVTSDGVGFHSGRVTTRGRFSRSWPCLWEARIKIQPTKGCWPAFWFLGNRGRWPLCGEVDVLENYGRANDGLSQATVHSSGVGGQPAYSANFIPDTNFHLYQMLWEKDEISIYRDHKRLLATRAVDLSPWPFNDNEGMYCLLNIATNGTGTGGVQPSEASVPVQMLVDYVRCMVPA